MEKEIALKSSTVGPPQPLLRGPFSSAVSSRKVVGNYPKYFGMSDSELSHSELRTALHLAGKR